MAKQPAVSPPIDPVNTSSTQAEQYPCGLMRRLAAIFYDAFLLFALLMLATLIVVALLRTEISANNLLFQLYLLTVAWAYFAVCWRGGQSLGMMAWRIHIEGSNKRLSWSETAIRFLVAILSWLALGLGFFWSLFHPQRATWHDLASGTRLVHRPLQKKAARAKTAV